MPAFHLNKTSVRHLKEHSLFLVIFALCLVLRFVPFFQYQFTLDELSGLGRTTFDNFNDLIEKGVKTTDTHPALIQLLIFCLAKLFGYANWIIKLPFLLMGFGAIVYAYCLCLRHFSKQAGVYAAAILSFSLIFVFYAPIARMYVAGVFLSVALLFYFFEIFFSGNNKISNYFFLGFFAWLCALNQHLNALFALTVCASGVFFLNKTNRKPFLITCALVILCYLPHLPVTLYQLKVGGIGFDQDGWLPPPEKSALFDFLKVLLGTGKTWIVFFILIAAAALLNRGVRVTKKQMFLLLIFLVNFSVIYFYSIFRAPVFQNSVMLFSAVGLVLLIASLMQFKNSWFFYGALLILCGTLIYKTYIKKEYYSQAVKTVFEYQFERTAYYKQLYGDLAVYPVFFDADAFMKSIYFKKYGTRFACSISSDSVTRSMRAFAHFVAGLRCNYLALASSMPAQQAVAAKYFPYLVENTQTQGINYKLYSKNPQDKARAVENDPVLKHSTVADHENFSYEKIQDKMIPLSAFYMPVNAADEFPFDARAGYSDVALSEGQVVLVKARYRPLRVPLSGSLATCISVTAADTNKTYNYTAKETGEFVRNADSSVTVYVDNFIGTTHRDAKGHSNLNVYVWNKGKDQFAIKEFEISLVDYWRPKWHFWD